METSVGVLALLVLALLGLLAGGVAGLVGVDTDVDEVDAEVAPVDLPWRMKFFKFYKC